MRRYQIHSAYCFNDTIQDGGSQHTELYLHFTSTDGPSSPFFHRTVILYSLSQLAAVLADEEYAFEDADRDAVREAASDFALPPEPLYGQPMIVIHGVAGVMIAMGTEAREQRVQALEVHRRPRALS